MSLLLNLKINKSQYFSYLVAFFPLSFIAGNLLINLNMLIIIFSAIYVYGLEIFKIRKFFFDKLILLFFSLVLLTGIYNDFFIYINLNDLAQFKGYFSTTTKSFAFLKYLLVYFSIRFLIEKNIINLKNFFFSCLFSSLFVCLDIFYQFLTGSDIFGFEVAGSGRKLSGPFGDELIAGSYIQRFSIFSFFLFPIYFANKTKHLIKFIIPTLLIIFLAGIILSGNRMPFILFIFTISLIAIFQKEVRKFFLTFFISFGLIFSIIFVSNYEVRTNFKVFHNEVSQMTSALIKGDLKNDQGPQYLKEFSTFYHTWLMNKYVGGGIKNFRYYCHERADADKSKEFVCNMHPHNYYLEILTETGIIGFILIVLIFSFILYHTFIKKYFSNTPLKNNLVIIPFIFLLIAEIFPLKSTGSFFTTGNTTFIFILIAIAIGLAQKDNSIENKF